MRIKLGAPRAIDEADPGLTSLYMNKIPQALVIAHYNTAGKLRQDTLDYQVTLMNTSFVIADPEKLCQHYMEPRVNRETCDVYGLVKSHEIVEHLQSFLLTFSNRLMRDTGFIQWWDSMQALNARHEVIYAYELGLSHFLSQAGYPLMAAMTSQSGTAIPNPSHANYEELLEKYGILKIELIRDNPFNINLNRILAMAAHDDTFRRMVREGLDN